MTPVNGDLSKAKCPSMLSREFSAYDANFARRFWRANAHMCPANARGAKLSKRRRINKLGAKLETDATTLEMRISEDFKTCDSQEQEEFGTNQPVAGNDTSQWQHQALHDVQSRRVAMPEAWECVPSGIERGRPSSWWRQVIVVGVLGPSGAGKSSLCRRLSRKLNCPYESISTDGYVRRKRDLPRCPHRASDPSVQWSQDCCYELPCSYDLNGFHDELLLLVKYVAQCKKGDLHPYYMTQLGRQRKLQPAMDLREGEPVYIIVEGFILFAEPAIVHQVDELVWLHVPWETSCERRCKREGRNPEGPRRIVYKEHIHAAHLNYQRLLLRNVGHREVLDIDASGDADDVLQQVLARLTDPKRQKKNDMRGAMGRNEYEHSAQSYSAEGVNDSKAGLSH